MIKAGGRVSETNENKTCSKKLQERSHGCDEKQQTTNKQIKDKKTVLN